MISREKMIVYVKEKENALSIEVLEKLVKSNVILKRYCFGANLQKEDFLMVSRTEEIKEMEINNDQIVVYEDVFEEILESVFKEIGYNFDYYYLKNAIQAAEDSAIETIITGSSYGLFGIETDMLPGAVNLALASQDLFYSIKEIETVCNVNHHIRNIILCCSHYYLFSDLSKSQNCDSVQRMSKVYAPLFGDVHNAIIVPPRSEFLVESCIFDVRKIMNVYSAGEYEKNYFNSNRLRDDFALRLWDDKTKKWAQLTETEKEAAARERVLLHNKNQKREITLCENAKMLNELSLFCSDSGINLIIVVTPVSKHYSDHIWSGFRDVFYDSLDRVEGVIHLLDLYADSRYVDEDFIDTNHASDSGAQKITCDILNVLQAINLM